MSAPVHPIPSDAEIGDTAERLSFPAGVGQAMIGAAGECRRNDAAQRMLATAQAKLLETEPGLELTMYAWPEPPVPLFYGVVAMSLIAQAEERYRERGVAQQVAVDTLWDIGQQVDVHRRIHGEFDLPSPSWLANHLQARIAALGRLQFALETHWFEPAPGLGLRSGDPVLGVHIPEQGPFPPAACDDSFAQAESFFSRHYPEFDLRGFTCVSWLLDPALADRLPAGSNIVAFQRRFTLSPDFRYECDDAVTFTFRTTDTDPDRLPTDTTLQRAIVDRLRDGERWAVYAGSSSFCATT